MPVLARQLVPRLAAGDAGLPQQGRQVDRAAVDVGEVDRGRGADAPQAHREGPHEAVDRRGPDLDAGHLVVGELQLLLPQQLLLFQLLLLLLLF